MSLIPLQYECPNCFGYTGYPGHAARANPGRKHLACACPSDAELDALEAEQLTETQGDPFLKQSRAA